MNNGTFKLTAVLLLPIIFSISCKSRYTMDLTKYQTDSLVSVFNLDLKEGILDLWYPLIIDTADGGYYSNLTYEMRVTENQPKMLVTQSRQVWTSSQAAIFYNDTSYTQYARHGVRFLIGKMWDKEYGGFYNLRTKTGGTPEGASGDEKRAYGNAFAIYGLSSFYQLTKDPVALDYAKKTFLWLDEHSRDRVNGGYIDAMNRQGAWLSRLNQDRASSVSSTNSWKDFNSSIHILEAFTGLYKIWPDPLVRSRLEEMFLLVRDTFTGSKGYLTLYFTEDWKPISNRDSSETVIRRRSAVDHISFGHDVETGYLLLEASLVLGLINDTSTLRIVKKIEDHSLAHGFDWNSGAFFDAGYYLPGSDTVTILNKSAEWWVEAEGLNALLMMAEIFPENGRYFPAFLKIWKYIDTYLIDKEHGDWYIRGLYFSPDAMKSPKASIWKANYHNGRALMNCIRMLKGESELTRHFSEIGRSI